MLNYELTMDDHLAYNEWLVSLGQKRQGMSAGFQGFLAVLLFAFGAFLITTGLSFLLMFGVWFVVLGLIALLHGPLAPLLTRIQKRKWKEMLQKNDAMKHYQGMRRVGIEAEGLRIFGPSGERMIRWNVMSHVATPTLDIFHVAPGDAIVVPRHAFRSEQQREGFLTEIERRRLGEAPLAAVTTGAWWTQGNAAIDEERQKNTLRH